MTVKTAKAAAEQILRSWPTNYAELLQDLPPECPCDNVPVVRIFGTWFVLDETIK